MSATFAHVAHIADSKFGFSGRPQKGYNQYEITFSGLGEFGLPYEKKFTFRTTLDGKYFAVAGRDWSARSFDELIKNYSAGSAYVRSISTQSMLFDFVVFTADEIKQARLFWAQEQGVELEEDVVPEVKNEVVAVTEVVAEVATEPITQVVEEVVAEEDSKEEAVAESSWEAAPEMPVVVEEYTETEVRFCTPELLKESRRAIQYLTKLNQRQAMAVEKAAREVQWREQKVAAARTAPTRTRAQQKLEEARARHIGEQEELGRFVADRDRALRHQQHLESLPKQTFDEKEECIVKRSDVAVVLIRTMTGDLIEVEVDMPTPIYLLVEEFVRQRRYNRSAGSRLVFAVDGEDEPLLSTNVTQENWERSRKTWSEVFQTADAIPMFNLFIQAPNDDEYDIRTKVDLIRQIAEKKKLEDNNSTENLYSLYSEWILTYRPSQKGNRYTTMSDFVDQHLHLFPELDEEAFATLQAEKKYRKELARFKKFRANEEDFVARTVEWYGEQVVARNRDAAREQLRQLLAQQPDVTLTNEQSRFFRRWVTVPEMLAEGMTGHQICACHQDSCMISRWEELEAALDEAELKGWVLNEEH
jgi:hypothetical protein